MSQASEWCTIESDPGVFTELIESFGVSGIQVEELYELNQVYEMRPVYGLIFLFKWQNDLQAVDDSMLVDDVSDLFFARQVVQNACATQALISILLNNPNIDIGEELKSFKEFAIELPPDLRGLSLSNSQKIRESHNSFGRPETFELPDIKPHDKEGEDAFHFISYLPFNGKLYELDGLKPAPVLLGDITDENWLDAVIPVIQERIQKYSQTEIRFNLMAVIAKREDIYEKRLSEMKTRKIEALARLNGTGKTSDRYAHDLPEGKDELTVVVSAMDGEIEMINDMIQQEQTKFLKWRTENARRKHNYIPLTFNLLRKLAEKGMLQDLIDKARTKQLERRANNESKKTVS